MNITLFWLVLAVTLFVLEAATVGMVSSWFGIGAAITMIVSFFTDNIYVQLLIFIVVSLAMLILLRPLAKKAIDKHKERTNVCALIGKSAVLTESIGENSPGRLKHGDVSWLAVADNGEAIEKGTKVKIKAISGNKLIVNRI